ncbi:MAG: two pore domain potassium channel family protein, partial [Rhizobiales bacterium]|nr:two pore domain potassium channel family protein [Hyphomicrobiales bacterium]
MPYLLFLFNRQHWRRYSFLLAQIDIRRTLIRAGLYLLFMFALHSWIMVEVEGLRVDEAIWLTLTTVVTVGYGDHAAKTLIGRIATVLLLYVGSIFMLFHVAADYFQYRSERKLAMLRGRWKWQMNNHVLLLNSPSINRDRYILGLVEELHRTERWAHAPVLMLTRDFDNGLPEEFQTAGVVHYYGDANIPEDLDAVDAAEAAVIVVLAENAGDKRSDEITFNILHRLRERQVKGRIIAECVRRANRARLKAAGADCVMRPIRFYPEIVVRAIDSPGTEQILENLFTSEGDDCRSFDVAVDGVGQRLTHAHVLQQWLARIEKVALKAGGQAVPEFAFDQFPRIKALAGDSPRPVACRVKAHQVKLARFERFQAGGVVAVNLDRDAVKIVRAPAHIEVAGPIAGVAYIRDVFAKAYRTDFVGAAA